MTILVLTADDDPTAGRVCRVLDERGHDCVRLDLAAFPQRISLTATGPGPVWTGRITTADRVVDLATITAVYYRRPGEFDPPESLDFQYRRFAVAEARQAWGGLLGSLPVPVVNPPGATADAELKPAQLQVAADVGFLVPDTVITSEPREARAFARAGRTLYKPLSPAHLHDADGVRLVYATVIDERDLDDDVRLAPCQLQRWVDKDFDVRLTAVGRRCLPTAILAHNDRAHVDWRADYGALTYDRITTPAPVVVAVHAYLDHFGLRFGCFDFTVDRDGRWWFLECGPNAQWGWIEDETSLPIASTLADLLTGDAA